MIDSKLREVDNRHASELSNEAEHLRATVRTLQLEVKRLTIERDQQKQLNDVLFDRLRTHHERLKGVIRAPANHNSHLGALRSSE